MACVQPHLSKDESAVNYCVHKRFSSLTNPFRLTFNGAAVAGLGAAAGMTGLIPVLIIEKYCVANGDRTDGKSR